ncbi:MAG TPA: hypothetical protein DEF34_13450 [Desulfotomaculum sp.]|nr:hypothetical protein [Desulfotomaculum sp.]
MNGVEWEMSKGLFLLWGGVLASLALLALLILISLSPPEISSKTLTYFERAQVEKGQTYAQVRYISFAVGQAITILVLSAVVILLFHRGWVPLAGASPYLQVMIYSFLLFVLLAAVSLPLEFYRGFMLEHRFGFSTQGLGAWFVDYGKGFIVNTVLTVVMFAGLYLVLRSWPLHWPLVGAGAFVLFLALQAWLWPLFIDPLFHKFEPLSPGPFKDRVVELAAGAGIEVGDVLVMDASRQTTKVNAYFTGVGQTKRIVFYDNLLRDFSQREAELVVAHEIGHWKHHHITLGMLLGTGGALLFFLLYRLVLAGYGAPAGHPATVPLLLLFMTVFSLLLMPVQNTVSRAFERQADRTSIELTGDAAGAAAMSANLATRNLADVQPHPFIRGLFFTHPPTVERIAAFEELAGRE